MTGEGTPKKGLIGVLKYWPVFGWSHHLLSACGASVTWPWTQCCPACLVLNLNTEDCCSSRRYGNAAHLDLIIMVVLLLYILILCPLNCVHIYSLWLSCSSIHTLPISCVNIIIVIPCVPAHHSGNHRDHVTLTITVSMVPSITFLSSVTWICWLAFHTWCICCYFCALIHHNGRMDWKYVLYTLVKWNRGWKGLDISLKILDPYTIITLVKLNAISIIRKLTYEFQEVFSSWTKVRNENSVAVPYLTLS